MTTPTRRRECAERRMARPAAIDGAGTVATASTRGARGNARERWHRARLVSDARGETRDATGRLTTRVTSLRARRTRLSCSRAIDGDAREANPRARRNRYTGRSTRVSLEIARVGAVGMISRRRNGARRSDGRRSGRGERARRTARRKREAADEGAVERACWEDRTLDCINRRRERRELRTRDC